MYIAIEEDKPVVRDLPEGNVILFFGKVNNRRGYCVIFGPPERCLPDVDHNYVELFSASIAFGVENATMEILEVKHGHKYAGGGGMVEFGGTTPCDRQQLFFRTLNDPRKSTYEGRPVREVYIAL